MQITRQTGESQSIERLVKPAMAQISLSIQSHANICCPLLLKSLDFNYFTAMDIKDSNQLHRWED